MKSQAEWRQWLTPSEAEEYAKLEASKTALFRAMYRIRNRCKMRKRASEGYNAEWRARSKKEGENQ